MVDRIDSGMVELKGAKARTPKELAKLALKNSARAALERASWPTTGRLTIQIGEDFFTEQVDLTVTGGIKDGRIMFHAGGKSDAGNGVVLTTSANFMLNRAVADHKAILAKYGLPTEMSEADLDAGESV